LLQTILNFFYKFHDDIPSQFKNMTTLNKFMKSDDHKDKHSEFLMYHLSMIDHDPGWNIEDAQKLGDKKQSITFIELCTLINSILTEGSHLICQIHFLKYHICNVTKPKTFFNHYHKILLT